jgi:hypothetical protein
MTALEAARIYVDLVSLDGEIRMMSLYRNARSSR